MKSATFVILCLAWLADMAALAAIGPLGRNVPASMVLYGCGFALLVLMLRTFPERLKASHAYCLIALLGLAPRIAFFFFPPNTDIYRYIWEGAVQSRGFNPYVAAPADPALASLAQGELNAIWRPINNKPLAAVYPPGALLFFRLLAWISPTPILFKSIFLLFDLGVMVSLAVLLRLRRLPAVRLLLYAANPLGIVFICGEGHLDVLQTFFLCIGCCFLVRRRHAVGALSLGMAVMSKYLTAAAAPFFWERGAGLRWLAVLPPLVVFCAYLRAGPALFGSLGEFGANMHYNDGLTALLRMAFADAALAAAGLVFLLSWVWIWLTEDDPLRAIYLTLGCLLVLLPTLHPWYLVLMAPFLCVFPSWAWLCLQAAMLFTFPTLGHEFRTGVFQEIPWLKLLEYLPFFGLVIWGCIRSGRVSAERMFPKPRSISVLVPALNEAGHIAGCLDALQGLPAIHEIIVADGGSSDGTPEIAGARGARVIAAGRGRGVQIRAAAETARGDVLLILHADAFLHRNAPERLLRALTADRNALGGCFGMAFADASLKRRLIAALNNLKAFCTGIAFGDQAQFVRREALEAIGGFPPLMLMEDVELSLRLKRLGRPVYLKRGVTVSGRRWRDGAFRSNLATVMRLFFPFLIERRLGMVADAAAYYRNYYGPEAQ